MLHSPPDVERLRQLALEARDGTSALGADIPPSIFVPVHAEHLLVLLDAVTQHDVDTATTGRPGHLPAGWLADLTDAVGALNNAIAESVGPDNLRAAARTIAQLLHAATDALTP